MVQVELGRVLIRRFKAKDAPDFLALAQDQRVAVAAGLPNLTNLAAAEEAVRKRAKLRAECAITYDDQLIGQLGIYWRAPDDDGTREIGYALAHAYWGQGVMTAVLTTVISRLQVAGLTALWASVAPDNERSVRLLTRVGFHRAYSVPLPIGLTGGTHRVTDYYELRFGKN